MRAAIAIALFAPLCGQLAWANSASLPPDQVEFFEAKIRPILVEHCYKCHSNEAGKSKGDLLLDSRDAFRKGGVTGAAFMPGDPEKSLLIEAIRYKNEDLQMPPAEEGGKLPDEKIALLEQWVRLGAPDPRVAGAKPHPLDMNAARRHWAFQPVAKPAAPAVRNAKWVRTPVDAFILAKLEANKLAPAAAADKRTLLRRITYDLTGLPPTPEEVDAFLADRDPNAYAKVVERLLASPRYGERWGRFWLDVARYADTKGYLAGNVERRYPFSYTYRDYVIRAFSEDKPFDQFIVEQIAADHLPLGEDKSALAGMGFLTLGRRFLNNQNDIIDDRIDVVTRGFMGLTVTCARCHDHKFDPIPTKDYYSLHGVFASSDEPNEKPLLGPLVDSEPYQEFLRKKAAIETRIREREKQEVDKFLAEARAKTGDYLLAARDAAKRPADQKLELFAGERKLNVEVLKRWQTLLDQRAKSPDPVLAPWFALAALPEEGFADKAKELIAKWSGSAVPSAGAATSTSPAQGDRASGAGDPEVAPPGRHNPVIVDALAKREKPIASLKEVVAVYNKVCAELSKPVAASVSERKADHSLALAATDSAASDREAIRELLFADNAPPNLSPDSVRDMIRREINNRTAAFKREIEALNWTEPGAPLRAMAMVDRARPVEPRVFLRGNPANRGPEVPRQFLEILSGRERAPFKQGSGRFELAQEIASARNPLTARVFVNRVWGWHFGQALVRTPSDFGVRTEAPVHRELLDWLAASFVENNWSVKQLHRWIVLSSAYQQSSHENPKAAAADPDNQLVHRFNRRRLEFEALRDSLLAAAGTLELKPGGLPDDLTKEPFTTRRTVYGFIDRQNMPGMLRTFDYPNPDTSTSQRFATTVPQQALFMMNSPFVQEQARQLVRRAGFTRDTSETQKIHALYRIVHQRAPEADELRLARAFVQRPASAATAREAAVSTGWQYGHGAFDPGTNRVKDFQAMAGRKDGRLSPTAAFPDESFGHLSVTAAGGHPGRTAQQASIRRWTSPGRGSVRIEATLGHASEAGDGVRGRIVSSHAGKLGEWSVHNGKADTKLESVEVRRGETLDFIVEANANPNSDTYTWSPVIAFTPHEESADIGSRTWNARKDFELALKVVEPLTRWDELAQVLLLSNELAFVD